MNTNDIDIDTLDLVELTDLETLSGGSCGRAIVSWLFNPGDLWSAIDAGIECAL